MDNDRGDRDNRGDKDFYNDFATPPPTDDGVSRRQRSPQV